MGSRRTVLQVSAPGAKLLSKLKHKPRYAFDPTTGTLKKVRGPVKRTSL